MSDDMSKVLGHLDRLHARLDAMEKEHAKDRAETAQLSARADAWRKDAEEKERADKARRDAEEKQSKTDKARADGEDTTKTLDEDANEFAEKQLRADSAYQAWSRAAPPGLYGETLRDYRVRLLKPLQQYSATHKGVDLARVADPAAFSVVENSIINDAIEASNTTVTAGAPLREVVTRNDSGHVFRKFIGDASVTWAPFMGGAVKFGRINKGRWSAQ